MNELNKEEIIEKISEAVNTLIEVCINLDTRITKLEADLMFLISRVTNLESDLMISTTCQAPGRQENQDNE